jgi:hypothetical protein
VRAATCALRAERHSGKDPDVSSAILGGVVTPPQLWGTNPRLAERLECDPGCAARALGRATYSRETRAVWPSATRLKDLTPSVSSGGALDRVSTKN